MKFLLGVAIITASVISCDAAKAEWIYVASDRNADVYLEDSSIVEQGSAVEYWKMDVFQVPAKGRAKRIVAQNRVVCSNNTATILSSTAFSNNGKKLNEIPYTPGKTANNIPGTVGYAIQQMVCGN